MSLSSILSAAAARRRTLHHYSPTQSDLPAQFAGRNVAVESHPLPTEGPPSFVVIRDADGFRGAISDEDLQTFLSPETSPQWRIDEAASTHRTLYDLLDDTVFASLDRQQLLGATREIEDRAYRVGHGRFHVGFQSLDAFDAQRELYEQLAGDTDLDIHAYFSGEAPAEEPPGITLHVEPTPDIGRFWVMAFDGGEEPQQCALVAKQHGDTYEGVWTYDPRLVQKVFDGLGVD